MRRYRLLLALGVVMLGTACGGQTTGSGAPAASGSSGLMGKVTLAPGTPTCKAGTTCTRPAVGIVLVFSRYGKDVVVAKTDKDGNYRVKLSPGRYELSVRGKHAVGQTLKPLTATVPSGRLARVDLRYDVGIR
jgi:hypothetical protein